MSIVASLFASLPVDNAGFLDENPRPMVTENPCVADWIAALPIPERAEKIGDSNE